MVKKQSKAISVKWQVPFNLFLYGESNEGKTTTLKKLYEKLTNSVFTGKKAIFPVFTYKGKQVYICSAGDGPENILRNIKSLDKKIRDSKVGVDIFITAVNNDTRKNPNSLDVAQDFCGGLCNEITRSTKYALWVRKLNPKVEEETYIDQKDSALQKTSEKDAERLKKIIDNFLLL